MSSLPPDAPKSGEVYLHYKGDEYRVVAMALHSDTGEWMVVYEPLYHHAVAALFVRPLSEWLGIVEWKNGEVSRFTKIK